MIQNYCHSVRINIGFVWCDLTEVDFNYYSLTTFKVDIILAGRAVRCCLLNVEIFDFIKIFSSKPIKFHSVIWSLTLTITFLHMHTTVYVNINLMYNIERHGKLTICLVSFERDFFINNYVNRVQTWVDKQHTGRLFFCTFSQTKHLM